MKKFIVAVYAKTYVVADIEVEAETKEQAMELAVEKASEDIGACDWQEPYDNEIYDEDIDKEMTEVRDE